MTPGDAVRGGIGLGWPALEAPDERFSVQAQTDTLQAVSGRAREESVLAFTSLLPTPDISRREREHPRSASNCRGIHP